MKLTILELEMIAKNTPSIPQVNHPPEIMAPELTQVGLLYTSELKPIVMKYVGK